MKKKYKRLGSTAHNVGALGAVGWELQFKPLLVADTNHGNALSNDNRPSERSYGP